MSPKFGTVWSQVNALFAPRVKISTADMAGSSVGISNSTGASAWSSSNRAIFWPIIVEQAMSVTSLFIMNGGTLSGNFDLGIFTPDGTKLISTGSTAQAGASIEQIVSVSAFNIGPGLYYMGAAFDNTTSTVRVPTVTNVGNLRCVGVVQMDTAFTLPATATFATLANAVTPMMGFIGTVVNSDRKMITPATINSFSALASGGTMSASGSNLTSAASAVWTTANKAFYIPFVLPVPATIAQFFILTGATAAGNVDVGVYEKSGARIVSSGSTAQTGTNSLQVIDVTDTQIGAGEYYLALALNGTTGTTFRVTANLTAQSIGIQQQTSAFPLPATATFTTFTTGPIPVFGFTTQAVV